MLYRVERFEKFASVWHSAINGLFTLGLIIMPLMLILSIWDTSSISALWSALWPQRAIIPLIISIAVFLCIAVVSHLSTEMRYKKNSSTVHLLERYHRRLLLQYAAVTLAGSSGSPLEKKNNRAPVSLPMRKLRIFQERPAHTQTKPFLTRISWWRRSDLEVRHILRDLRNDRPIAVLSGAAGMGKTTALRWCAFHVARARLLWFYPQHFLYTLWLFGKPCWKVPVPLVLHMGDYARRYASARRDKKGDLSLQDFLTEQLRCDYPQLSTRDNLACRLLRELDRGHCLVFLDGLSEVIYYTEVENILSNLQSFLLHYLTSPRRNYFVFTISDSDPFPLRFKNTHYALALLKDCEIQMFIANWCNAFAEQNPGRHTSSTVLREQQNLWEIIAENRGIKKLAGNALMLTILTWLYCLADQSGENPVSNTLFQCFRGLLTPLVRFELFKEITQVLLIKRMPSQHLQNIYEDCTLAERALYEQAYQMHVTGLPGDEKELRRTVRRLAGEAYSYQH